MSWHYVKTHQQTRTQAISGAFPLAMLREAKPTEGPVREWASRTGNMPRGERCQTGTQLIYREKSSLTRYDGCHEWLRSQYLFSLCIALSYGECIQAKALYISPHDRESIDSPCHFNLWALLGMLGPGLSLSLWCCCWCTRSLRAAPLPYFGLAGGDRDWASSIILLGVRVASLIKNPRLARFGSAGTDVVTGSEEGNYCLLVIWYTAEARERQKKGWQTIKNNLNWWSVTYQ